MADMEMKMIIEALNRMAEDTPEASPVPAPEPVVDFLPELDDVIFRMRSYSEVEGSEEFRLGVETGLQMAAEMLENLKSQLENGYGP